MALLFESSLRASIVLLAATMAMVVLRRRSAAVRHWVLAAAVIGAVVAPALQAVVPSWHLPVDWPSVALPPPVPADERQAVAVPAAVTAAEAVAEERKELRLAPWIIGFWAAGGLVFLLGLASGLMRLNSRSSRAQTFDGRPATLLDELTGSAGEKHVRLLRGGSGTMPMTWGWRRAVILLPDEADSWSEERLRVVLLHELAHIRRGDWAMQMTAECMRAVHWFSPFAWLVSTRLRAESELACDDIVLAHGVDGPAYATQLLELARAASRSGHVTLPVAAMARPSSLERRFRSMLQNDTNRAPMRRSDRIATVTALLAVSLAAAALSTAQTFSSFSGSIFDATNRVVPSMTITMNNPQTGAIYSIKSGPDGRFQFVGLAPGDYQFEATGAGFQTLRGAIAITGQNVERDLVLSLGSLEETLTIRARSSDPAGRPVEQVRRAPSRPAAPRCESAVGGNIRPPMKLVHVNPVYPESARLSGLAGTVVVNALIGADGLVRDVTAVSSPHPDLEAATIEAVRQWEFSETYLNCVANEVRMKVTANFSIEQ